MQVDWVGDLRREKFKDLPNMNTSIAQTKAELCFRLKDLVNKAPSADRIETIQKVRDYKRERDAVMKIAGNRRSSVPELSGAIAMMEKWFS